MTQGTAWKKLRKFLEILNWRKKSHKPHQHAPYGHQEQSGAPHIKQPDCVTLPVAQSQGTAFLTTSSTTRQPAQLSAFSSGANKISRKSDFAMERLYRVKQHHLTNHIRKSLISLVTRINIVISTINPCIPEFLTCHQSMWNSPSVSGSCHQEAECRCLFIFHDGKHHEVQHCYGLPGMPKPPSPRPSGPEQTALPSEKGHRASRPLQSHCTFSSPGNPTLLLPDGRYGALDLHQLNVVSKKTWELIELYCASCTDLLGTPAEPGTSPEGNRKHISVCILHQGLHSLVNEQVWIFLL